MKNVNERPTFASRFRELCGVKEQSELADMLDVTKNTFRQWTNGNATPTMEKLIKLSEYFNVSIDYLAGKSRTKSSDIETQAAALRYGLNEEGLQSLERLTAMARLHEKYQRLTDSIVGLELTLKDAQNDTTEDFIKGIIEEKNKIQTERDALEVEMLAAADPGEGYFILPQWQAPLLCRRAWQRLHAIGTLLTLEKDGLFLGEQALDEIGEYFYMGDMADGFITYSNGTPERHLTKEEVADLKLVGVQKSLVKVRQALTP